MASGFGELVLVLGDSYVPHRAAEIPEKFQKMLVPNKIQHILCTGNLVSKEQYEDLRALAPNVHVVRGDSDLETTFPDRKIVPWGDQASLSALQRKMNVDILITGHTHEYHIRTENGKWFVNPGSITGAFSATTNAVTPSFILMAIQGPKVVAFVYELKGGENVVVSKSEFTKEL
ncbi:hypothetical protein PINS_up015372 [Pythium insidiosum]|nr:hypothetical protein PINS_up015372 [Pythium insidiosum]